jgi:hypothetical protein
LGVSRHDWVDLHWVLALALILVIFVHLALHWNWAKGSSKKYLRVGPKTLAVSVALIIIFFGILIPGYLTNDFPKTQESSYKLEQETRMSLDSQD